MVFKAEPSALLSIRHPSPHITKVLVQWQGLPSSEATWEDYHKLLHTFLSHHLVLKVKLLAGGSRTT